MNERAMNRFATILPALAAALLFLSSCKKDDGPLTVHGNVILKVQVLHHNWTIHYLDVYLKHNATEWPGRDSTRYDRQTQTNQDGQCRFDGLYPGNYYLYGSGYDPVERNHVIGYMPVVIPAGGLTDNTLSVTLYVTE